MTDQIFVQRSRIGAPAQQVFNWHARSGALERLTPPWAPIKVVERQGGIENGSRVVLSLPFGPTHVRWVAEHYDYEEGRQFRDRQVEGPFARWEHTHRFEADGQDACYLEDRIDYALPFGAVGSLLGTGLIQRMLQRQFAYRHRITAADIADHAIYSSRPLHFLISGANGLIGSALGSFLTTGGHRVTRLVRSGAATEDGVVWDVATGRLDTRRLDRVDVVVHLAGEGIANRRWSAEQKQRIRDSRVNATHRLCESLTQLNPRPRALLCASAIGYYGDRGNEVVDEDSAAGTGFLAEVCREWEQATAAASASGIRTVNLRFGVVLTPAGGALAKLLPPFQLGAGGRLGSGTQYMSWVSLDDVLGAILHCARAESLHGAVNIVAPAATTNSDFTKCLGNVLRRPTLLPLPAAAARLALGEMADEMLLASAHVRPKRLAQSSYRFRHSTLELALRHLMSL